MADHISNMLLLIICYIRIKLIGISSLTMRYCCTASLAYFYWKVETELTSGHRFNDLNSNVY